MVHSSSSLSSKNGSQSTKNSTTALTPSPSNLVTVAPLTWKISLHRTILKSWTEH